jgi:lysozyme
MNEDRVLSLAGANLIKHFENCLRHIGSGRYQAYRCPAGVLSIGFGHTNHHGRKFHPQAIWSAAECDAAFREDMIGFEAAVRRLVKVELEQHQFDALVSFAYNCGEGALAGSTLLKKLNAGDFTGATAEFHRWNKGGGKVLAGLTRRRASEALLFQNLPDNNYDGKVDKTIRFIDEEMPQGVDEPG